ncbi:Protein mms22 [Dissostichus eleginoides]|uniref:Protein mms22 n=1 Tax=Dissostichus eleginoides TaxID=100907 RepID=A0AAD9BVM4_DISEL|nr:Protein mms22 [Dissostichus eleginoides]
MSKSEALQKSQNSILSTGRGEEMTDVEENAKHCEEERICEKDAKVFAKDVSGARQSRATSHMFLTHRLALHHVLIIATTRDQALERQRAAVLRAEAGNAGGMKRLAASDDSSPLMSLTAINSTLGSRTQHSPPPAALLPGLGFLYTPPSPSRRPGA